MSHEDSDYYKAVKVERNIWLLVLAVVIAGSAAIILWKFL
jgi:hypothetical protein